MSLSARSVLRWSGCSDGRKASRCHFPVRQFFTVMMAVLLVPISISGWALRELALVSLVGVSGVAPERALVFSVCFGLMVTAGCLPGALAWLMSVRRPAECGT